MWIKVGPVPWSPVLISILRPRILPRLFPPFPCTLVPLMRLLYTAIIHPGLGWAWDGLGWAGMGLGWAWDGLRWAWARLRRLRGTISNPLTLLSFVPRTSFSRRFLSFFGRWRSEREGTERGACERLSVPGSAQPRTGPLQPQPQTCRDCNMRREQSGYRLQPSRNLDVVVVCRRCGSDEVKQQRSLAQPMIDLRRQL